MRRTLVIAMIVAAIVANAQPDSSSNKRKWIVAGTDVALITSGTILLNEVWYKEYPRSSFHTFNDASNWRYMDKLGHSYTAYQLCNAEHAALRWAGVKPRAAVLIAGGISLGFQTTVEILDGFSAEWGFSWADMTANTLGSALFVSQQLIWKEQRIRLKFGYKPSPYAKLRPSELGSSFSERLLKDYNAQSYWLCVSPGSFLSDDSRFPKWLQLSVGYSADQLLKGSSNQYTLNGITYNARSEYALSLDIDWSRLPIKRPWLRKLVKPLNMIKFPLPAVYWRNGVCYMGIL